MKEEEFSPVVIGIGRGWGLQLPKDITFAEIKDFYASVEVREGQFVHEIKIRVTPKEATP